MVKKDSKFALSMTYGPREDALLRDIEKISKNQEFDISRNEVLRRGLYAFKNLVDVDERIYLKLLSHTLHLLKENIDLDILRFAKDIASQILTILIIKHGLAKADSFETILDSLETIYGILSTQKLDKTYDEKIKKELSDLATSLDTVFLNSEKDSQKLSNIMHFLQLSSKHNSDSRQHSKTKFDMSEDTLRIFLKHYEDKSESMRLSGKFLKGKVVWFDDKKKIGLLKSHPKHDFLISPISSLNSLYRNNFELFSGRDFLSSKSKLGLGYVPQNFEDDMIESDNS
ncbi:hypothetical protein [Nitrosopumilus maritimus]|uniref:Uncharacterized protein n=1 Tax=Nitrosopumilus maritimus (strain SCM1) TaxID=436308 RepID=A9A379_NITMS|nr:hypothetical protein [Nitrosopumilus maritimus]ABX12508.1 hypothetical protein Nmar_0612 [Nitrosopumilus maritimus SCM1]